MRQKLAADDISNNVEGGAERQMNKRILVAGGAGLEVGGLRRCVSRFKACYIVIMTIQYIQS